MDQDLLRGKISNYLLKENWSYWSESKCGEHRHGYNLNAPPMSVGRRIKKEEKKLDISINVKPEHIYHNGFNNSVIQWHTKVRI